MNANDFLDRFNQQLSALLGSDLQALDKEMRQHIRTAAQSAFGKMDLVTREEFDAQRAVLMRTREKLEALERQVATLEQRLEDSTT